MLATVPVYAVLAEDTGQRGAYRVAYQQFHDLLTRGSSSNESKTTPSSADDSAQKRNRLLLLGGVLTTLFMLGAKSRPHY
jgi:hypothetical protein